MTSQNQQGVTKSKLVLWLCVSGVAAVAVVLNAMGPVAQNSAVGAPGRPVSKTRLNTSSVQQLVPIAPNTSSIGSAGAGAPSNSILPAASNQIGAPIQTVAPEFPLDPIDPPLCIPTAYASNYCIKCVDSASAYSPCGCYPPEPRAELACPLYSGQ